jgi:hypothetical protein
MYFDKLYENVSDTSYLIIDNFSLVRIFEENLSFFSQYPLSTKLRFEGGLSYSMYSYRIDSINYYYYYEEQGANTGEYVVYPSGPTKDKAKQVPDPFNVGSAYLAFVGDNSSFGITSPMMGYRYRFQIGQMFDEYNITNLSLDVRKYFFLKPISLAFRAMHYGRYGNDANELYPLYLGNEYLIRGYNFNAFYKYDGNSNDLLDVNNITGSKIIVFNSELRFPFTGVKRFSLMKSGYLFSDIILFFDAGVSWTKDRFPWLESSDVRFHWNPNPNYYTFLFSFNAAWAAASRAMGTR